MKTKNAVTISFIIRSGITGLFLDYGRHTTHTGTHTKVEWTDDPFAATRLRSILELDYNTRKLPEITEAEHVLVKTTSLIEIET